MVNNTTASTSAVAMLDRDFTGAKNGSDIGSIFLDDIEASDDTQVSENEFVDGDDDDQIPDTVGGEDDDDDVPDSVGGSQGGQSESMGGRDKTDSDTMGESDGDVPDSVDGENGDDDDEDASENKQLSGPGAE